MKIRVKLLMLLLAIALLPLVVNGVLNIGLSVRFGRRMAQEAQETIKDDAFTLLGALTRDYSRIIERDVKTFEAAAQIQAIEVERRLANGVLPERRMYFNEDYMEGGTPPEGMMISEEHKRTAITHDEQVYFVVDGVDRDAIADDLTRLSTMPNVYKYLHREELMYWQYTSLESGIHTSYPGHGGYSKTYDPRKRKWYQETEKSNVLTWVVLPEVSTHTVALTVAMPVRRSDGSFAGVTAIDVPLSTIREGLIPPARWKDSVETMLVTPGAPDAEGVVCFHEHQSTVIPGEMGSGPQNHLAHITDHHGHAADEDLLIFAGRGYEGRTGKSDEPFALDILDSPDREELNALKADALAGKPGIRRMRYRNQDCLWAYGAGHVFPVVIVPYDVALAKAKEVKREMEKETDQRLRRTVVISLVTACLVAAIALLTSRTVTRPVRHLAKAAARLTEGDFTAHVDITTRDELQDLGNIFNEMGPKLQERERMKRSLLLAMEIQQTLLPQKAPRFDKVQISGESVYCDETGGDYFDYIDLSKIAPGKVGIALGDVSGHGLATALLMASARGVLRSTAQQHGDDPPRLFDAINRHLAIDIGEGRFMTLFYGVLDTETRQLAWASAGHDPAVWVHADTGDIEELPNTGFPLGIVEDAEYESEGPVTLARGDVVAIGTDGIWEADSGDGTMFSKERFYQLLRENAHKSAHDIRLAVIEAVRRFLGSAAHEDDITLVVIKAIETGREDHAAGESTNPSEVGDA